MKDEYDFTHAVQGKFFQPLADLDIPIYLDKDVREFFLDKMKHSQQTTSLSQMINTLIKKDIEIARCMT